MALNDLIVNIAGDTTRFKKSVGQVQGGLLGLQGTVSKVAAGMKFGFGAMLGALGPLGAALAGISVVKGAIGLAAEAEQTAISFEVLTGSVENATKLVGELKKMGAATPFEFTDLAKGTKTLLAFGRTQDQVLSDLDMLSNIASGDAQKLDSLATVFGQIAANGRLTGGDLMQLINVGFNPLNEIAKVTGESMGELRKRMEKGQIGLAEVEAAFKAATSQGGLFFQMNEKQSKTMLGKWSTFKDNLNVILTDIGASIIEAFDFKSMLDEGSTFLEQWKNDLLPSIKDSIKGLAKTFKQDVIPAIKNIIDNLPTLISGFSKLVSITSDFVSFLSKANGWIDEMALNSAAAVMGISPEELRGMREEEKLEGELDKVIADTDRAIAGHQAWLDGALGRELDSVMADTDRAIAGHQAWLDGLAGGTPMQQAAKSMPKPPMAKTAPVSLRQDDFRANRSIEAGTREAFEKIFATMGGPSDKKKPEKETAKNTAETNDMLDKMYRLFERIEKKLEPETEVQFA
jgi:tape measure domain-containing protein